MLLVQHVFGTGAHKIHLEMFQPVRTFVHSVKDFMMPCRTTGHQLCMQMRL